MTIVDAMLAVMLCACHNHNILTFTVVCVCGGGGVDLLYQP